MLFTFKILSQSHLEYQQIYHKELIACTDVFLPFTIKYTEGNLFKIFAGL